MRGRSLDPAMMLFTLLALIGFIVVVSMALSVVYTLVKLLLAPSTWAYLASVAPVAGLSVVVGFVLGVHFMEKTGDSDD